MTPGHHKLDLSLLRRRHNPSAASSTSLSPTVPILESPVTFRAMSAGAFSEATMAQRSKLDKLPPRPPMFMEETDEDDSVAPNLTRRSSPDPASLEVVRKSVGEEPMRQTKLQYYEDTFGTRRRDPRDRVALDSVIVAEIKISNMVLDDEPLASMIASRLAQAYQKPEGSMMVTVQQNACIHFGISKDPAYVLKVYAVPCLIATIINLRCTIMIQSALRDLLQIESNRGVVLYLPVPEENFATDGVTYASQTTRYDQRSENDDSGILRSISRSLSRRLKSNSAQSAALSEATTSSWNPEANIRPSTSARGKGTPTDDGSQMGEGSSQSNAKKYKSLRHFLSHRVSHPHGASR
ncbi:hypothetical protein ETB97_010137 [Aspergillus alliaceus]|uniref:L-dopachrome isomerase n=1 Tax=Petromyces alliaceus TaxID=209559 RepID=A0A5N6G7P0_PETAA|nr:uncharacterized protein BDW43DRAFT_261593 [Aspergillus alliaceus]KAB8238421.1 hypothetical protein BDW43DRAFT_261593 [Aspergillus alliaceus]KAE8392309.1 hypothetical protein BDV23DRAFT_181708 [Aspergillus alliaceus]KAF5855065.1 hypothetical protein ETB97_010137 [Aspergillus burnettii]